MTIKKYNTLISFVICFFSVLITAGLLTVILDFEQSDVQEKSLEVNYKNITNFVSNFTDPEVLNSGLQAFISGSVVFINVYDKEGSLISSSSNPFPPRPLEPPSVTVSQEPEFNEQNIILTDGRSVSIVSSIKPQVGFFSRVFQTGLASYYLLLLLISFLISLVPALLFSKKVTKEIKNTAKHAEELLTASEWYKTGTKINEIAVIDNRLEDLAGRLKLKQKSRKTLIDEMIHQSRTPLTVIRGQLEAYEDGLMTLDEKELEVMYHEIDNLTSIITNMSGFIDTNCEMDQVNMKKNDVSSVVNQINISLSHYFEKRGLTVLNSVDPGLCTITDKYLLGQSVYNLLTNAGKYTPRGKKIYLSLIADERNIVLKIKDEGTGIDKNDLPDIFNAYFRGKNAAGKEGDGLGLFLVKENLNKINAVIDVNSSVNQGSEFIVYLPLKEK